MSDPVHKTIAEGFEDAIKQLNENNPTATNTQDVGGKLQVLEYHVLMKGGIVKKRQCALQMIINPWAWPKQCPTIDILGVEWTGTLPQGVISISEGEGRFRLTTKGSSLRENWAENQSLSALQIASTKWLEEHSRKIKVRPGHPVKNRSSFGLFYPGGMRRLLDNLETMAENKNWVLLNRDAEARQKQMEADQLKVQILKTESEILRSKSMDDLDVIDLSQFEGETLDRLTEMLEERREEFSWSFEDIVHEDENSMEQESYTPRKSRRLSDFNQEEE